MNVLMMVSWYTPHNEKLKIGIFHNEQAVDLLKCCNTAIYWPYDSTIDVAATKHKDWGIITYRSRYDIKKKFRNRWNMYRTMRRIVKEFKPDLIHAQVATEAGRFAVALGKLFRIPVMITEHSAPEGSEVDHFPHYYYAKFAYGGSKYNACVSDSLREHLEGLFPQYEFHTIYNGTKVVPERMAGEEQCCRYRVPGAVNCVIAANFYNREIKGFHILLPVMARLRERGVSVVLHLLGDGEHMEYYKNMAKELGISEICIFHGHCAKDEVYEVFWEMDFLVSASLFESFGCSLVEAMMTGMPVVATRCGGPESIVNSDNGILVEKNNEDALYAGMKKMCGSYGTYAKEKIREYAIEHFSMDTVSRQYAQLYRKYRKKRRR